MKEKASDLTKALCLRILAKSFLTAYALCTAFHAPLAPGQYETFIDYAIASIYEILGEYDLRFFLLLLLAAVFYRFAHRRLEGTEQDGRSSALLAGFFALCLLFGQSYHLAADSSYILGSPVNLLKSALSFGGYAGLFRALIGLVWQAMDSHGFTGGGEHFFSRHAFSRSFLILAGAYLPFLLLAFPGNLCWDAIGQIEQVMGSAGYSTHHPLFHTLIMGGLVKAGQTLFHSPEIGLFVYMLLQDAMLAAALAGACRTRRAYRERNIPDEIFLNTMGCFRRFLMETHEMSGRWAFDRGFWTWRQTGCLLFRLGTLEFEYCGPMRGEHRPKELAEAPVVNVHIPSDAVLTREELDRSYDRAERFFAEEGHALCHQGPPRAVLCGTWLLAPALAELLPEGSGIRCFAGDYRLYAVEEDAPDFYRWLFGSEEPLPVKALPERTSLQRRAKARLAAGGKIGAACGILTR